MTAFSPMKTILTLLVIALLPLGVAAAESETPKDRVEVASPLKGVFRTSPGASQPDRISLGFDINYELLSEPDAVVSLAFDDGREMQFETFNSATVTRGHGMVTLGGSMRLIQRDNLHVLVVLKKAKSAPGDKPLASTAFTIQLTNRVVTMDRGSGR